MLLLTRGTVLDSPPHSPPHAPPHAPPLIHPPVPSALLMSAGFETELFFLELTKLGFSLGSHQMSEALGTWNSHQSDLRVEVLLEVARNLSFFHR